MQPGTSPSMTTEPDDPGEPERVERDQGVVRELEVRDYGAVTRRRSQRGRGCTMYVSMSVVLSPLCSLCVCRE